jgi:hypothetical protein
MAISPKVLTEKFKNEVQHFEFQIDASIRKGKLISNQINIAIPNGCTDSHFIELRQKYLSAGWKDVILCLERDESWIKFVAP